jgi:hypothetical protein
MNVDMCVCGLFIFRKSESKEKSVLLCCAQILSQMKKGGTRTCLHGKRASCMTCIKSSMHKFQEESIHCVWISIVIVNGSFSVLTEKVMYIRAM